MPTNTKEYMREYQRARRAKIKNSLQDNVKVFVKDVKVFDLHPPIGAVKVEKEVVDEQKLVMGDKGTQVAPGYGFESHPSTFTNSNATDSKTIDFSYLTNNSSFQRAIMEFIRKFVPGLENIKVRGNKEVMKQSFDQNANNYRNVMKELKTVLEKRKK